MIERSICYLNFKTRGERRAIKGDSFGDSTSSRVEDKLKTIRLCCR